LFGYELLHMTRFLLALSFLLQVSTGLQSQAGIVTGIIRTDIGIPLGGVRVAVTPANESTGLSVLESLGQTDSTGRYRLENVSPGRYHILVGRTSQSMYHPGVAELDRATTIQVIAGSTVEVPDMVIGGGAGKTVSGRVIDMATGKSRRIENVVLCCDTSKAFLIANPVGAVRTFTIPVSDDGSFIFPIVPPGNYSLSVADPNIVPASWALAVGESHVAGLELNVTEGVEVQGTILDQNGEPVAAAVRLRPNPMKSVSDVIGPPTNTTGHGALLVPRASPSLGRLQDRIVKAGKEESDSIGPDGHFALHKVYPGAYILEINTKGVTLLEREVQIGVAGLTTLSFQVPVIHVAGRVVAPAGRPLPKLNYVRLIRTGADSDVFYGFPDTEGLFSLLLVPGDYQVFTERLGSPVQSLSNGSRDITNAEFTFDSSRNQQIVVTLEP